MSDHATQLSWASRVCEEAAADWARQRDELERLRARVADLEQHCAKVEHEMDRQTVIALKRQDLIIELERMLAAAPAQTK